MEESHKTFKEETSHLTAIAKSLSTGYISPHETRNEDETEKPTHKTAKILTKDELNKLGAKIVKAELQGNEALAEKLKKKLEKARKAAEEALAQGLTAGGGGEEGQREEEVLLTTTNARGEYW